MQRLATDRLLVRLGVAGCCVAAVVAGALLARNLSGSGSPTAGQSASLTATVAASSTFTGMAFDTCGAPSASAMNAWLASPYRAAGIYIGGSMRACGDGNLSAAWVSQVRGLGWGLLPLYVGLQAPCVGQSGLSKISAAHAATQGTASADDAVSRAKHFGLGAGTPVYYDMEAYNPSVAGCSHTVMTFLSAWSAELHRRGYKSGAYGSTGSLMVDLAKSLGTSGFVAPDDVWFAHWNQLQTSSDAASYPKFADSYWRAHQRVHQYSGGSTQTWGGVSMNIDANWVDGLVAGSPVPVSYGTNILGPGSNGFVFTGSMTYWRPGAPAGLKHMAYWTKSNGSTESNGASWSPHLSPGKYDVEVYVPATNATAKAPYTITDAVGTTHKVVNQQQFAGKYTSLGTYTATSSHSIAVHVGDNDPSGTTTKIGVDAINFRLVLTVPGPPTGVSATAGNAQAVVSWISPANNGGTAITGYTVTASPGGRTATATGAARTATVTGLSNATAYTFTVTATNSIGKSSASAASAPVTPKGPPAAPSGVSAVRGNQSATLSWTAPTFDGGSAVTGYNVLALDASNHNARTAVCPAARTSTTTSCTATGLTNGHSYTFSVAAMNAVGTGPAAPLSAAVTPATVPSAPTHVSATSGSRATRVAWTAPYNGGSSITGYVAKAQPGGETCVPAPATATSCTITGLLDGASYNVTVTAANAVGTSPDSAAASVVPLAHSATTATVPAATTYGHPFSVPVTVTSIDSVSGTVTASNGSKVLGTATLGASTFSHGLYTATARVTVSGTALATGTYRLGVTYHGNAANTSSSATTGAVTVRKEPTATSATLKGARAAHRRHATLTVTVTAYGTTPTGVLAIFNGKTRIARVTLHAADHGRITITLPLLSAGPYRLTAHYLGNRNHSGSTSRAIRPR